MKSNWYKHSALNTLEHVITRGADAATSLMLILFLNPEKFSALAFAQAIAAPCLLFFVTIENVLYRDYSVWKSEGVLNTKVTVLRRFGYSKMLIALLIALGISGVKEILSPGLFAIHFWGLLWALFWMLSPQIFGADREFLRIDLRLRELNAITLFQKLSMLAGTALALAVCRGNRHIFFALALVPLLSTLLSAAIARTVVLSRLNARPETVNFSQFRSVISEAMKTFSFWQHLNGVIQGWVQTMDVFLLGLVQTPARILGLYAFALKMANFSMALPTAFSSFFMVWLGRELKNRDPEEERSKLWHFTRLNGAGVLAQAVIYWFCAPLIFSLISRKRWTIDEQTVILHWFGWMLLGSSLYVLVLPLVAWLMLRMPTFVSFRKLFLPWGIVSVLSYGIAIHLESANGAAFANVLVGTAFAFFGALVYQQTSLVDSSEKR
jgi:hypothetical protein